VRDSWFEKQVTYMQRINDLSLFDDATLVDKAEDYCTTKSDWVMKENESKWVDCFKKSSNVPSTSNPMSKDFKCTKPPFTSNKLLKMMMSKANMWGAIRYLDYLTLKCNIADRNLHTTLGSWYIG